MTTTKIIYFSVDGRPEQAEFPSDCPAQDVKEVFRAAAEAGPYDILKLYNTKGNIINISPKLESNTRQTQYKLEVVAADCKTYSLGSELATALGFDLSAMEKRLQTLEKKILVASTDMPSIMYEMRNRVESFREKLESVEHLSWLGLFKELSNGTNKPSPFYHKRSLRKTKEECQQVMENYLQMSSLEVTEEVRQYLKTPTFDNWQWEDAEIMVLLQLMYIDLDFMNKFNIEMEVLQQFLFEVYRHYNNIPFHNFKHCFCVTQMMYGLIWLTDLQNKMDDIDILTMLTSAICHDLDHPGYNNAYQINARTELALRYNDISPLENHHCSVAFNILEKSENNIFRNLTTEQFKRIREGMIKCVLATDMTRHNEILNQFRSIVSVFDFNNKNHKDILTMIIIKVSDISNEARPLDVAEPWLDCLLQEFFNQSDMEKLEGLPVSPFMDRDKVTKPSSQTGFIRFVLLPLFIELANLFPSLEQHIIDPVRKALDYYTEMEKALEKEKQNRTGGSQCDKVVKPLDKQDENQKNTDQTESNKIVISTEQKVSSSGMLKKTKALQPLQKFE
ncbi:high affinity cGMP-specific 3',5'-cyclic phosphodiesterase 9A [Chiloscyllium plagiosum]|uniref:high affinity cGMP-specific 3',5'-cyclic phosphodiesterase 9A n=1 Tax=Chiloscyllium plagiosum TaxID=36176 RepID=UPI001CB8171D|nr:high affinity cGMP-specific 3',5'-cyclic phosphodiesterase 9A [Chiloscyllium plagiosum]